MALVLEMDAFAHQDGQPVREVFALGQYLNDRFYELNPIQHPLELLFPERGESSYHTLELSQTIYHLSTLLKPSLCTPAWFGQ